MLSHVFTRVLVVALVALCSVGCSRTDDHVRDTPDGSLAEVHAKGAHAGPEHADDAQPVEEHAAELPRE